jgi:hypothetical protein
LSFSGLTRESISPLDSSFRWNDGENMIAREILHPAIIGTQNDRKGKSEIASSFTSEGLAMTNNTNRTEPLR